MRDLTLEQVERAGRFASWRSPEFGEDTTTIFVPGIGILDRGAMRVPLSEIGPLHRSWYEGHSALRPTSMRWAVFPRSEVYQAVGDERPGHWHHLHGCDCEFCAMAEQCGQCESRAKDAPDFETEGKLT